MQFFQRKSPSFQHKAASSEQTYSNVMRSAPLSSSVASSEKRRKTSLWGSQRMIGLDALFGLPPSRLQDGVRKTTLVFKEGNRYMSPEHVGEA
ncbi:hypothetical protein CTAM01_10030 [Colletotrichum tamarilloi]|uniref:Uncharacterized protein n=1 Tax=Colletotrichum tamarilloi TaxID=1209934 RepID=A0ABQ9R1W4_9PEZI|nr:uncharacterized protein CTAM01_10030 [Colletotrichum tamarilloi]KAK1492236.1 hypothetical protein CTAM01_10030 [Colletotrichum tamarilloi]